MSACSWTFSRMAPSGFGLQSPGIDEDEAAVVPLGLGHQTVAGGARHLGDYGMTPPQDAVEEGRFTDVGPSDDGDNGKSQSGSPDWSGLSAQDGL